MTPRLFMLLAMLAVAIVVVVLAAGSGTFLGLGLLGWVGVWLGAVTIDMILRQEWPAYTARRVATERVVVQQ
jgi:hypothetical protein